MKIDVLNFNKNSMLAKLLIVRTAFERNDILSKGKKEVMNFANRFVKDNFIYPSKLEETITLNLVLFLLGDSNNKFKKCLIN